MRQIPLAEAAANFAAVMERVSASEEPVEIVDDQGNAVKIVPVPKPKRIQRGRPVYDLKDAQFLDVPPY